jgi:glutaredoxin
MTRVAFVLLATLVAGTAWAEMYRWVDRDGRVHYTDQPPASATSVEKHKTTANVVTSTPPYAVQQAAKGFPVKLYTGTNCGSPCSEARELFAKRGVPYTEVSVTQPDQLEELKRVSGGDSVPVVLVGRAVLKGFEPVGLNAALDNAGYPSYAGRSPSAASAAKAASTVKAPDAAQTGEVNADGGSATAAAQAPKRAEAPETAEARGPYAPR